MTGAVLENAGEPPMVLHFGVPMNSPHVKVLDTWRTLGMRGTGSHDVMIDGHVVPDAARRAASARPANGIRCSRSSPPSPSRWSTRVYLGVAESARDIAIDLAKKKSPTGMRSTSRGAWIPSWPARGWRIESMLAAVRRNAPSAEDGQRGDDRAAARRRATPSRPSSTPWSWRAASGFYRSAGLERKFRDIQAARYHPLQTGPQAEYAGAMALGLPVERVF